MSVDPYQLCPCGSGKKLKFCCIDLIHEIEKIHRMIEGDQPRAALRHVEQTLVKQPGRTSLLDLKASLEIALGELEAAGKTVEDLVASDQRSATAFAQKTIYLAHSNQIDDAVQALQSALNLVEVNMPQRVLEAIGVVGSGLLQTGDVVAARAHFWLYQSVVGESDSSALQLLVRMNQVSGLPLLLRDQLSLRDLPDGHPVAAEMGAIIQLAVEGKWQMAAAKCDELLPEHLDQPLFFYNRALLSGYLGDAKNFAAGLRLYARQDIPHDDAVEAEAIALLVDEAVQEEAKHSVEIVYSVSDEGALVEKLISHNQTVTYNLTQEEEEATVGPKPQGVYLLLDRPVLTDFENLTRDDVPHILGYLSHYSRQTDRQERLQIVADNDEGLDQVLATLKEVLGETLGEKQEENDAGPNSGSDAVLSWRWHFPPAVPPAVRRKLLQEERQEAMLNRWPDHPRKALADKAPREAAKIDELKLTTEASIFLLEQGTNNMPYGETFAAMRSNLGLPALSTIPGSEIDANSLPIVRISRVELSDVSDDDLALLYKRSVLTNATQALRHIAEEAITRDSFENQVPRDKLFEHLFTTEEEVDQAISVLDRARAWCDSQGKSNARWDLLELELHIADNNTERAREVLQHLSTEHANEPDIAEQIYQLLYMLGAIPPDEMPGEIPDIGDAAAASPEASVWTPEGQTTPGGGGGESKLWIPD